MEKSKFGIERVCVMERPVVYRYLIWNLAECGDRLYYEPKTTGTGQWGRRRNAIYFTCLDTAKETLKGLGFEEEVKVDNGESSS